MTLYIKSFQALSLTIVRLETSFIFSKKLKSRRKENRVKCVALHLFLSKLLFLLWFLIYPHPFLHDNLDIFFNLLIFFMLILAFVLLSFLWVLVSCFLNFVQGASASCFWLSLSATLISWAPKEKDKKKSKKYTLSDERSYTSNGTRTLKRSKKNKTI